MVGFPNTVNLRQAPGVEGDFYGANPRRNVLAGEGQIVAGSNVFAGRFAWLDPSGTLANCNGTGLPAGMVGRSQQGLITTFLSETTLQVMPGMGLTLYNGADLYVRNSGSTITKLGDKAYANYSTGLIRFGAANAPTAGASGSASSIAAGPTTTATGSITDTTMTLTGSIVGTFVAGGTISGTNVTSGTTIIRQLTGTTGGVGTYQVSVPQTVPSTTITETYGVLTVGGTVTGTFAVGGILSGTNVVAGTTITQFGTGTGGAGTYYVSNATVVASTAISETTDIETKWSAESVANPGELVKFSSSTYG